MEFALVANYVYIMIESKVLYSQKFSKTKHFSGLLDFPEESNFHDKNFVDMLFLSCVLYLINF